MPKASARQLAAKVDELYLRHRTRIPKHQILGAFVAVGLEHVSEVEARLADGNHLDGDQG
jgi:hypothetical protein